MNTQTFKNQLIKLLLRAVVWLREPVPKPATARWNLDPLDFYVNAAVIGNIPGNPRTQTCYTDPEVIAAVNKAILADFNGSNQQELAHRYGRTRHGIDDVIRQSQTNEPGVQERRNQPA